jgi:hypothetical protein
MYLSSATMSHTISVSHSSQFDDPYNIEIKKITGIGKYE